MVPREAQQSDTQPEQTRCPACHHAGMSVFIEIEGLPAHCNLLWSSRKAAMEAKRGEIRLGFCHACGMVYNLSFDPGLMRYTQRYENSLEFSPKFQQYARELAARLIGGCDLRGKDIIEIGCGKGQFLSLLCQLGHNRGIGFDPSYEGETEKEADGGRTTFIRDFYSEAYAGYTADLICCRHTLEHIHRPHQFLSEIRRAIGNRKETMVFFEVPDALFTLRDLGIWDIIYEHCSYFSAPLADADFRGNRFHRPAGVPGVRRPVPLLGGFPRRCPAPRWHEASRGVGTDVEPCLGLRGEVPEPGGNVERESQSLV